MAISPVWLTDHRKAVKAMRLVSVCQRREEFWKTESSAQNLKNSIPAAGIFSLDQEESLSHKEHSVHQTQDEMFSKNFIQLQVMAFISLLDMAKCALSV